MQIIIYSWCCTTVITVGLETKGETNPDVPLGIFDGASFSIQFGTSKIYSLFQVLWRYGLDLFRMNRSVQAVMKDFSNIYTLQASGQTFSTVEDMLCAMGGREMFEMTQVVTNNYLLDTKRWNKTLMEEIVGGALRMNYGQALSVNAFTTFVSLAGMEDGCLWSVVGGNRKIAEKILEASGATLTEEDVISVQKVTGDDGRMKYKITTEEGTMSDGYDVVIVANPLNLSTIKYENFPCEFYTEAATTPYQRTVATFVCGEIRQEFFGGITRDQNFPQVVLTTASMDTPFRFNSVAVQIPSDVSQAKVVDYCKPIGDDPQRVWKVFSPQPLTEEQLKLMFTDIESTQVHDWQAYPHYSPPEQIPPFVLDDGVYYINAIEKAASAMEMSAIGAKNAALLAKDYILKQCTT